MTQTGQAIRAPQHVIPAKAGIQNHAKVCHSRERAVHKQRQSEREKNHTMAFEQLTMAPADPILGLTEAFKNDENPDKINLGVGVYRDEHNRTPVLECVERAERVLAGQELPKTYLPISGMPEYGEAVRKLLLGEGHDILADNLAATVQTPGGTGALRIAGDFIKTRFPGARIWLSDPTWANHANVFGAAGLEMCYYPYYDAENKCLAFDAMADTLGKVPADDVVLLHGCCHNPSGMDPTAEQWECIAEIANDRGFLPLVDFAYQGLGDGLDKDAAGLRALCRDGAELLVASSFSKNFGLYNERVGALTVVAASNDAASLVFSHLEKVIRANYSNPPAHGVRVVQTVLNDPDSRTSWEREVGLMRKRINGVRKLFVDTLRDKGVTRDFSFLTRQKGMFSFSGLTETQVDALRERYSIYMVKSGRINVAGINRGNVDYLCEAIAEVLGASQSD